MKVRAEKVKMSFGAFDLRAVSAGSHSMRVFAVAEMTGIRWGKESDQLASDSVAERCVCAGCWHTNPALSSVIARCEWSRESTALFNSA